MNNKKDDMDTDNTGPMEKLPIDIPLRNLWRNLNQELEDTAPDLSQSLLWDTNGTHPGHAPRLSETTRKDRAARREAQKIGEDTQNRLEKLEKEIQENQTPPTQPFDPYSNFLKIEKENKRKQELDRNKVEAQIEEQVARLKTHGAKPPGPREEEFTPLNSPDLFPLDPRIERNRFGTVSPVLEEWDHAAPAMSPGGHHMGEGSQRVSILSVEYTPGGKHAKAGSQWFSFNDKGQAPRQKTAQSPSLDPSLPAVELAPQTVPPAVPSYPPGYFSNSSDDSSLPVIEIVPQPITRPRPPLPALVLGERYASATPITDAEGDTP